MQNAIFLNDDQRMMWAEAGTIFPGEQLNQVVKRALTYLPVDQPSTDFYEIRRFDAPHAFDALLKLQGTGSAKRHIVVDKDNDECREVLRIEATLLDLIMQAIAMLLDVLLRVLDGALKGTSPGTTEAPVMPPISQKCVPSWHKQQPRIEHNDDGFTR
ncbi:hypothetical protein [Pseudomonas sp. TH10]|uniref:hypothetical protein n=1 Tax=Pseudomonas sp. TH10 TaxID=2796376 RepID=UPI001913FA7A|nr:hypothetical protein [Pseudomonas sp. TH10]MBK5519760.1 hypothetical protein [Pseudomonas sp. TH10]